MGITTGGNINISGIGNVVDLNVTGPAIFNTDIYVGGTAYIANMMVGTDGLYTGNLTVQGELLYSNVSVVSTSNLTFGLANNQSNVSLLNGGGWTLGNTSYGTFLYNYATDSWQSNLSMTPAANSTLNLGGTTNFWNNLYVNNAAIPGNLVGNLISGVFIGNGGNLSNIQAGNIVGNIATAITVTDNAQPNITSTGILSNLTVSGNVYAGNIIGNYAGIISNAVYANTAGVATAVTSNLQPNINLLGTLTSLSVSGNSSVNAIYASSEVSATGNITGNYIFGNGSQLTGIITSVSNVINGASNLSISAANANITMSVSTVANVATVTTTGLSVTGSITATGNISANNLYVGNTLFTRTLTVGTIGNAPVTVPLASNNSFNVLLIGGANVEVYTT